MTATEAAFRGLIDYAGLYPPAALDMRAGVRNYLAYAESEDGWMLGRFVVELGRLDELKHEAGDALARMPLSVIVPTMLDSGTLPARGNQGFRIESVEIKCDEPLKITRFREHVPENVECYFEIAAQQACTGAVDAMAAVNARAKMRMGGVVADAVPAAGAVAERLELLVDRNVLFKATAGLHHPLRSLHRLTYAEDSSSACMHGFVNLLCAAAVMRFGGKRSDAVQILNEQDATAFRVTPESIAVHGHTWDVDALGEVRQFFVSFGSCSFTEPTADLKDLGWL